jgi:hypothetical protein
MEVVTPISDAQLDRFLQALDLSGLERLRNRIATPETRRFMGINQYLIDGLLQALRRDMRSEEMKKYEDPDNAYEHGWNVRLDKELLDLISPKNYGTAAASMRFIEDAEPQLKRA